MRSINRLTAASVRQIINNPPHRTKYYADGANLFLQVSATGAASWILRYQLHGRVRDLGLGSVRDGVTLNVARERAAEARRLKSAGIDPLNDRVNARAVARREAEHRVTFGDAAARYIELRKPEWSLSNHVAWESSVRIHAAPLARMDVSEIDTPDILRVVEPLWLAKHATGVALRQRLEAILDWSKSHGYRSGDNPARFDAHLENLLPKLKERTTHRAALDWRDMPAFMTKLRGVSGDVARCVEFAVLSGARSGEATGAVWSEIDVPNRTWRIPAERTKQKREHWVPLSDQALRLLEALPGEHRPEDRLFNSERTRTQIAGTVLRDLLRKLGYAREQLSMHGARSSLRTFFTESLALPSDIAESALGHDKRDGVRKAYERTRHYAARIEPTQAWANHLDLDTSPDSNVVPLRASR
ncbi:tyrosine-type recombinase/integrase [Paraburkholderia youngii]|uniref:Tyrosine-type recombinase/integrase n=1 Tax=Paraburkholderia youngii TaxID=2782701 RepID=A0A7Y6K0E2_9BURK|nr:site-specific integrase [Paraburkholderia youngii]NUY01551.1 tyrosine-type recombinase/integrase [Paraburkholderia youngii]